MRKPAKTIVKLKTPFANSPSSKVIILFNKPFNVLTQFTNSSGKATLADYIKIKDVYAAGRLDYDSEGLVVLTNDGRLQAHITEPRYKLPKTYLVQVEGVPDNAAIDKLKIGVTLKDGVTKPAAVRLLENPPEVWPRTPPVRFRKNIPTAWIEITITEGRNRQVRRMTAAIGHPTLRLIRTSIGDWSIEGIKQGEWRKV